MNLDNAIVLVTGANRGLGEEFARQALARGARKVYAGARDPASVRLPGVTPVRLDVNDPAQVAEAAATSHWLSTTPASPVPARCWMPTASTPCAA
jgi:NAD(P)-dependent dehydrogenase (short-subunit alcohol dehydrogenase family)